MLFFARARIVLFALLTSAVALSPASAWAQPPASAPAAAPARGAELEYVVIVSRHGVRPPISQPGAIDKYAAAPWPVWETKPGYLTPHGAGLIRMLAEWQRGRLAGKGLLAPSGCADAGRVTILADSDERTRETGVAFAAGAFPGCSIPVEAKPEGTPDPLFQSPRATAADTARASAAIAGRIGGNAQNPTGAFLPSLEALDAVLAGCGKVKTPNPDRVSLLTMPSGLGTGSPYAGRLHGPVSVAGTLAENLLLEYTEGMTDPGWGCLDAATLRAIMPVNEENWNLNFRTSAIARVNASNLLDHILKSMEQRISGKPVQGALGRPTDRLLVLEGHDGNIVSIAGALGLDWITDGRVNDTPPGGALFVELWRSRSDGSRFVQMEYIAQTLEQMRQAQPLSAANPPTIAPLFVPACSGEDMSCGWQGFRAAVGAAIDAPYVTP